MTRTRCHVGRIKLTNKNSNQNKKSRKNFTVAERMFMVSTLLLLLSPDDCIEAWPFFSSPPNRATIYRNFQKFRFFSSVEDRPGRGRKRTTRTNENVEQVLNLLSTDIFASLNYISRMTNISRTGVGNILNENEMNSYKVGHVQKLDKKDFERRLRFCKWYTRWSRTSERVVWWSDECIFSLVPQTNAQNRRYRAPENLHIVDEIKNSHIKVTIWAAISSEGNIMFEVLEGSQTAESYLQLLQRNLPMMDLKRSYFQQDGAPIHTANKVVKYLKSNFYHHWIGKKSDEKEWPPRSPDLSPLDYFFWSYVQSQLMNYDLETKADLLNALKQEIPRVPKSMIQKACNSLLKRCEKCISVGGGQIHGKVEY